MIRYCLQLSFGMHWHPEIDYDSETAGEAVFGVCQYVSERIEYKTEIAKSRPKNKRRAAFSNRKHLALWRGPMLRFILSSIRKNPGNTHHRPCLAFVVIAPYGKQNKEGSDQADDHILHRVVDAGGQCMLQSSAALKDKVHRIFPYFPQHPDGAGKRNSEITGKNTVSRDDGTVLFHKVIKNDA